MLLFNCCIVYHDKPPRGYKYLYLKCYDTVNSAVPSPLYSFCWRVHCYYALYLKYCFYVLYTFSFGPCPYSVSAADTVLWKRKISQYSIQFCETLSTLHDLVACRHLWQRLLEVIVLCLTLSVSLMIVEEFFPTLLSIIASLNWHLKIFVYAWLS